MRQAVLLVPILFMIVMMHDVHVAMTADHAMRTATAQTPRRERAGQLMRSALNDSTATLPSDPDAMGQHTHRPGDVAAAIQVDVDVQPSTHMRLSRWRPLEGFPPFTHFPETPVGGSRGEAENYVLVADEPGVANDGNAGPSALERDWRGLRRDTGFFLGYQAVAAGILYLLPESVTKWTVEQRKTSIRRWWENVQHPQWDKDTWYVNYLGHPYFGAFAYTRARERGFGDFGGFWYAALLSTLYEFGIEALFERPSYQDLIITPVGGILLGALLFEPIRERIQGKPELYWYDHLTLALTDPLGTSNSIFERLWGIQAGMRILLYPSALASYAPFNEPIAGSLNRPLEQHRQSPGIGIEFVFEGRKPSARRSR